MEIWTIKKNLPFNRGSGNAIYFGDNEITPLHYIRDHFNDGITGRITWYTNLGARVNLECSVDTVDTVMNTNYIAVSDDDRDGHTGLIRFFYVDSTKLVNKTTVVLELVLDVFTTYQGRIKFNNSNAHVQRVHEDRVELLADDTLEHLWTLNSYLSVSEEFDTKNKINTEMFPLNIIYSNDAETARVSRKVAESWKYFGNDNYLYAVVNREAITAYKEGIIERTHNMPVAYRIIPIANAYVDGNKVKAPLNPLNKATLDKLKGHDDPYPTVTFDTGPDKVYGDNKGITFSHSVGYGTMYSSAYTGRIFSLSTPPINSHSDISEHNVKVNSAGEPAATVVVDAITEFECRLDGIDLDDYGHFKYLNNKITVNDIKAGRFGKVDITHEPKIVSELYEFMLGNSAREFKEIDPMLFDLNDLTDANKPIKLTRTIDPSSVFNRIELPLDRHPDLKRKGNNIFTFIDTTSVPVSNNPYSEFIQNNSNRIEAEYSNMRDRYSAATVRAESNFAGGLAAAAFNPISWIPGVMGASTGLAADITEASVDYHNSVRSLNAQVHDKEKTIADDAADGSDWYGKVLNRKLLNSDTGYALFINKPHRYLELKALDIFTKYGHATNTVIPKLTYGALMRRHRFTYWKIANMNDCISAIDLPVDVRDALVEQFTNGIRLWNYNKYDTLADYESENWEIQVARKAGML